MMKARRLGGWFVLWALAVGQLACTSMRAVGSGDALSVEAIEIGDRISVVDSRGDTTALVVTDIGPDYIEGTTAGETLTRFSAADMSEVGVRRKAPGKTAGLAATLSLLLFVGGLSEMGSMGAMQ
jgi:hypothetical protein